MKQARKRRSVSQVRLQIMQLNRFAPPPQAFNKKELLTESKFLKHPRLVNLELALLLKSFRVARLHN
jgi:hypothetical protein